MKSRSIEIISLLVIALLVGKGGKVVLMNLATHRGIAAVALLALIVVAAVALRRAYRIPGDDTRVVVTKYVAYLVAAALALWYVLAPAKWVPGSCVAAAEVALVFDMISIWARKNVAEGA